MAVRLPAVSTPEKVTVNCVAVAEVTVPATPLLNSTVLLLGVAASKPKPLMTNVVAVSAALAVLLVTTGTTFATANALPLVTELVVTTAVKLPSEVGLVVNLTESVVAVAPVTFPTAPRLKETVLFAKVVSKPKPLMVKVSELKARFDTLVVTTGLMVATCTAVPVLTPWVTTVAVRLPALGRVESVTVSAVEVALVTVPTAPLLKVTTLLTAVVSKPKPLMVNVDSSPPRLVVLLVITPIMLATCTEDALAIEFVVTVAVRLPTEVGLVPNVTVSLVAVASVTVPTAPLLNVTRLRAAVVSKPTPLISRVVELIPTLAVLLVINGTTEAT